MTTHGDGDGCPELTEAEKILLRAAESDIAAMSEGLNNGTATAEDANAAFARPRHWTSIPTSIATPCASHRTPESTRPRSRPSFDASRTGGDAG